nr:MAG TPA: Mannosyl-glycoprotein endo-beta-N-acetylglucosaminidase [Crassvirales sp.]
MKQKVFNVLISLVVGALGAIQVHSCSKGDKPPEIKVILHIDNIEKQLDFFSKSPQEGLMEALEYYGVEHPQIVYAQAVLETGHFKSDLCLNDNNLFGLYNSKKHRYHTFDHWTESVVAYLDYVQHRYKPPNDYYKFLLDIGYAKDPNYISKLKGIVNRNDKRRSE